MTVHSSVPLMNVFRNENKSCSSSTKQDTLFPRSVGRCVPYNFHAKSSVQKLIILHLDPCKQVLELHGHLVGASPTRTSGARDRDGRTASLGAVKHLAFPAIYQVPRASLSQWERQAYSHRGKPCSRRQV